MCTQHSLCALLPLHSIPASSVGLLPTIMLHCSSQTVSLLSCFLPLSCYFTTVIYFSAVTLLGHCHITLPLSTVFPLSCYFAIVMLLRSCCIALIIILHVHHYHDTWRLSCCWTLSYSTYFASVILLFHCYIAFPLWGISVSHCHACVPLMQLCHCHTALQVS